MSHFIQVSNVAKEYEQGHTVLDGISFGVEQGEWLAIVGKSGSGKSTLLNLLAGLDRPERGEIRVKNQLIHTMSEKERSLWRAHNVGFIFQFFHLLPSLTVMENILLAMDLGECIPANARIQKARTTLEQMGILHLQNRLPSRLSGGEQQRAAIARAVANDPPILVADEPTGNLDSASASQVFEIFSYLVESGKTVVMVTHDSDAELHAHRSLHLRDGYLAKISEAVLEEVRQ